MFGLLYYSPTNRVCPSKLYAAQCSRASGASLKKKKISQPSWIYYAPYRKMLNYSVWYELWREQGGYLAIFKAIVHTIVFILSSLTCPCVVSHLVRLRFEVSKNIFVNVFLFSKDALNVMHWLSIHLWILGGGKWFTISKNILSSTAVFNNNIRNVSWVPNQHIRIMSEGSCDTEERNNAKNSALPRHKYYL